MAALAIIAAIAAAAYGVSLWVYPWWPCAKCGGAGIRKHPGTGKVTRAHGRCKRCNNTKRHPRLGVKIFTPRRARDLMAGKNLGRYG